MSLSNPSFKEPDDKLKHHLELHLDSWMSCSRRLAVVAANIVVTLTSASTLSQIPVLSLVEEMEMLSLSGKGNRHGARNLFP